MRLNYARLEGKTVIPSNDLTDMIDAYKGNRVLVETYLGQLIIETMFAAHNMSHGPRPLWFCTRIRHGSKYRSFQSQYETYDEALEGHKRVVEMVKAEES